MPLGMISRTNSMPSRPVLIRRSCRQFGEGEAVNGTKRARRAREKKRIRTKQASNTLLIPDQQLISGHAHPLGPG